MRKEHADTWCMTTTPSVLETPDVQRAQRLRNRLRPAIKAALHAVDQPPVGAKQPRGRIENGVLTIPVEVLINYLACDMAAQLTNPVSQDRTREHFLD